MIYTRDIGVSSNGKTGGFDPSNVGSIPTTPTRSFTDRLMVGHRALILVMLVRIQSREPTIRESSNGRTDVSETSNAGSIPESRANNY